VAGFRTIGAVGRSIESLLAVGFASAAPLDRPSTVSLIRTEDLKGVENHTLILRPAVSLLLYRLDLDKMLRAVPSAGAGRPSDLPPLMLHYLVTAWAASAEEEQHLLGRVLQLLDATPVLNGQALHPAGTGRRLRRSSWCWRACPCPRWPSCSARSVAITG
jgi:hypothetical protein